MKSLKNDKGAITIIVLVSVLFMVAFLISSYVIVANKVKAQKEITEEIKRIYEDDRTMEEIYNSYIDEDGIIPIYTVEQLLAIGTGEKLNVNGKIYTFSNDAVYLLNNNLEFDVDDWSEVLGENTDWVPIGDKSNFEGDFIGNRYTITVTKIDNTEYIYSEENEYSEIVFLQRLYTYSYPTVNYASITGLSEDGKRMLSDGVKELKMPDTIINPDNGKEYTVTHIASHAFHADDAYGGIECANLDLDRLPNNLTSIDQFAFYNCTNLTLTSLPQSVNNIGACCFKDATNLALTELPQGLTTISGNAFTNCSELKISSLPSGIISIGPYSFSGCSKITISSLPANINTIGQYAFNNCTNITLTSLPNGITEIGNYAFCNCTNITLSELPSNLNIIRMNAFQNCTGLILTSLPNSITTIGANCFNGCSNIEITNMPSAITSIGNNAFAGCNKLTCLTYDGTTRRMGKCNSWKYSI